MSIRCYTRSTIQKELDQFEVVATYCDMKCRKTRCIVKSIYISARLQALRDGDHFARVRLGEKEPRHIRWFLPAHRIFSR
jgi:hypothetical protein